MDGTGEQVSLFSDPTPTEMLAERLGVSVEEFVEVFGTGWHPLPENGVNLDSDPTGLGNIFGPWYVAGDPYQLTLRPQDDHIEIGLPHGRRIGPHDYYWESHDRHPIYATGRDLLDEAQTVIANLLERRRATFRYCRYCRRLTPPEELARQDECHDCANGTPDVVY